MHQHHYSTSSTKTTKPFQLIHTDLWGPAPVTSTEGYRYYVHFIDDFSRYVWMYPLKLKFDTLSTFSYFNNLFERQFDCKIKSVQADWGGEYRSLAPLLAQLGIVFRHPCPHSHQENGKAERKHHYIVELGLLCLLK